MRGHSSTLQFALRLAGLMSDMLQLVEFWRQIEVCRTSNFRWRYAPLCSVLARRGAGDVGFALRN